MAKDEIEVQDKVGIEIWRVGWWRQRTVGREELNEVRREELDPVLGMRSVANALAVESGRDV